VCDEGGGCKVGLSSSVLPRVATGYFTFGRICVYFYVPEGGVPYALYISLLMSKLSQFSGPTLFNGPCNGFPS
jgi:hypothetical protein